MLVVSYYFMKTILFSISLLICFHSFGQQNNFDLVTISQYSKNKKIYELKFDVNSDKVGYRVKEKDDYAFKEIKNRNKIIFLDSLVIKRLGSILDSSVNIKDSSCVCDIRPNGTKTIRICYTNKIDKNGFMITGPGSLTGCTFFWKPNSCKNPKDMELILSIWNEYIALRDSIFEIKQ
jgi:hypothetical protein